MRIQTVYIKGFRNFKEVTINFESHSLMIGANDIDKTNLIYALRILLDRAFSDYAYELKESDFFAYEETKEVVIRAYLIDVVEECVVARLPGKISDDAQLVLQYKALLNEGKCEYQFYCGKSDSEEDLEPIDSPYYRKYLNIKYIGSKRDFWNYIEKSKVRLLLQAKEGRSEEVMAADEMLYDEIVKELQTVDEKIPKLSYVHNATAQLNEELNKLAIHNKSQTIVFETSSSNIDRVIESVSVTSKHGDKKLLIGGEGRINQIYLSLWASQNQHTDISNEVSIICIEEPEAYLHPHQQREMASYLGKMLKGQVLLTTHSPYIVSEFSPNAIIRLYKGNTYETRVASDGCSSVIADGFTDFGYRMSVIPAEAFFSDCVILVEGPSEMILYKTLAKQIGVELDRLNISVMSVEGVGFETYIKILNTLCINWIIRTDNDIFKIPRSDAYRYAGIERGLSLLNLVPVTPEDNSIILSNKDKIRGFADKENVPEDVKFAANNLRDLLQKYNILIANEGLEEDLYNSTIQSELKAYYDNDNSMSGDEIIDAMKEYKAINMYEFIKKHKSCLAKLSENQISLPLIIAKSYIESQYGTY